MFSVSTRKVSRPAIRASYLRPRVQRGFAIAGLMTLSLAAGCASASRNNFTVGAVPDDYRERHPIIVSESQISEDIPISANMRKLSFRDYNLVGDFASRFRRSGGRTMQVLVPSSSSNEVAAKRISHQIVEALLSSGITRNQISVSNYQASGYSSSAPVRISYLALAANVGDCGKWEENIIADSDNRQYGNFGCASQNNLAKMVANPADLIGPRGESSIDATRRVTVIEAWRRSGSTNLPQQF